MPPFLTDTSSVPLLCQEDYKQQLVDWVHTRKDWNASSEDRWGFQAIKNGLDTIVSIEDLDDGEKFTATPNWENW